MKLTPDSLPSDPEILRAMLLESQQEAAVLASEIEQIKTAAAQNLEQANQENLKLRDQLRLLRQKLFGRSSEKLSALEQAQLMLSLEALEEDLAGDDLVDDAAVTTASKNDGEEKSTPKRRARFDPKLPRDEVRLTPSCGCSECGGELVEIGQDVSEVIDVVPQKYRVKQIVRPLLSCRACELVAQSPAPKRVVNKGLFTSAFAAQVVTGKFMDHQPLYRQSEILARDGVEFHRSTLADLVGHCAKQLQPLGEALRRHVLSQSTVHADETTMPALKPGNKKTERCYMWSFSCDPATYGSEQPPAVSFEYADTRSGQVAVDVLTGFNGVVVADQYVGYNRLFEKDSNMKRAGCWAHARRKFVEVSGGGKAGQVSSKMLKYIAKLYAIEKEIKGWKPDKRRQHRKIHSQPVLDQIHELLIEVLPKTSKSAERLRTACSYVLNAWNDLCTFATNGEVAIDNNVAERTIRPVALGRKNYMFVGSAAGGERAALFYSLLSSAKMNGINPQAYLHQALRQIGSVDDGHYERLLPWNIDLDAEPQHNFAL